MLEDTPTTPQTPITKKQSAIVTGIGLAVVVAMVLMPVMAGPPGEGGASQWVRYLGRFHFIVLHVPIGMLLLVILLELGKLFRKIKAGSTLVPAFFTAASAVAAVVAGFMLYQSGGERDELLESHMWWGIGFASSMVAAFLIKTWVELAGGRGNFLYVAALLGSAGVMTVASHDGGESVHGTGFLRKEEPAKVRSIINRLPGAEQLPIGEHGTDGPAESVPLEDSVVYTRFVQPILDAKCVSCHGPDKQKGKLRMDTYEFLLAGGKEGDGIKPGNAAESSIIYRIHLPLDDDEHMPPENKKQIDGEELAILEWWIDAGASPAAKVAELNAPESVMAALAGRLELKTADEAASQEDAKPKGPGRTDLEPLVKPLQEAFSTALSYESMDSNQLVFTAVSLRHAFGDADLAKLDPVMPYLVSLDLAGTKVGDASMEAIAKAANVRMLRLSETGVTDAGLAAISKLPNLESLNLFGTAVTREGVAKLALLPNLKRLYLWRTGVDEVAAAELANSLPGCEILLGM
jgi:hypothetical protein